MHHSYFMSSVDHSSMHELHLQPYTCKYMYIFGNDKLSEPVSHSRAQLTMLKNSIIRMTSLMHHVHVNHLEQESITHINEAVQYIPHPHPHPHPLHLGLLKNGWYSICNVEHSTQKYAWAFISVCDQACSLHLCIDNQVALPILPMPHMQSQ